MTTATTAWEIVGDSPSRLLPGSIDLETRLEGWLSANPQMVEPGLLLLARQLTLAGGEVDLLCLDKNGRLVVVEIKRARATRDALAQALDYCACLATMDVATLRESIDGNRTKAGLQGGLAHVLETLLGPQDAASWAPDGDPPRITLVGLGMDPSLRRIVDYLTTQFDVPVNGVLFDVFASSSGSQVLVRSAVVDDELAAQQGLKRGRGGLTNEDLLDRAQQEGCRPFVEPILKVWTISTGRDPRPERGGYWSLAGKKNGRTVIAYLSPWTHGQPQSKKAWLEAYVAKMADDLGVTPEQLLLSLDTCKIAHARSQDDTDRIDIEVGSDDQSEAVAKWIQARYTTQ